MSVWIKRMLDWELIKEIRLGKTHAGLDKIGYEATLRAGRYLPDIRNRAKLSRLVRDGKISIPIDKDLFFQVLDATSFDYTVFLAVESIVKFSKGQNIAGFFVDLTLSDLGSLDITDEVLLRKFISEVIEKFFDVNRIILSGDRMQRVIDPSLSTMKKEYRNFGILIELLERYAKRGAS